MERRIALRSLTAYLSCRICRGYLIEATTVTECLHTFCKSCLVKHLEERNTCPQCETLIHQSHPLNYIAYDRTMQDVVYRLVPELQKKELKREWEFYENKGLAFPRTLPPNLQALLKDVQAEKPESGSASASGSSAAGCARDGAGADEENQAANHGDCHRMDEQVNLLLESDAPLSLRSLERAFIRVSTQATVTHLKKYLAKKIFNTTSKYNEVEILCNRELLGKDHTLKFVCVTRWRFKEPPLRLHYRPKMEL
ncbi:polycomb group RING finger protein 3-like isoform X2 [Varroa jacobsoni]|uniref:polycomb group RING finger protein 3-like isoform X2 n=1 Tax=Varroa jacobsoni TaxID=62625 RepID=UPI000BF4B043|nr:polycomb group RING finger protein 3-like isoform X2 [Varroa jacobsoni]